MVDQLPVGETVLMELLQCAYRAAHDKRVTEAAARWVLGRGGDRGETPSPFLTEMRLSRQPPRPDHGTSSPVDGGASAISPAVNDDRLRVIASVDAALLRLNDPDRHCLLDDGDYFTTLLLRGTDIALLALVHRVEVSSGHALGALTPGDGFTFAPAAPHE